MPYWFTDGFLSNLFRIFPCKLKHIVSQKKWHARWGWAHIWGENGTLENWENLEKLKMSVWVEGTFGGHTDQSRSKHFPSLHLDLFFLSLFDLDLFFLNVELFFLDLDLIFFLSLDLDLNFFPSLDLDPDLIFFYFFWLLRCSVQSGFNLTYTRVTGMKFFTSWYVSLTGTRY